MAQDSNNKVTFKVGLEPDTDKNVPIGQNDYQKAADEFVRDLDRINKTSSASSDLDRALSSGYNPNAMMPNTGANQVHKASSLPRKDDSGLSKNKDFNSESQGPVTDNSYNPRESAPDVNKNYGSSMPPSESNHQVKPRDEEPVTRNNGVPSGNTEHEPQVESGGSGGLPRKNDLENKDNKDIDNGVKEAQKELDTLDDSVKKEGIPENDSVKKAPQNSEQNPEAPNNLNKEKIDRQNEEQTGNGYGALKRNNVPKADTGDNSDRFYQNMNHSRRVQQGENGEERQKKPSSSGNINEPVTPSLGARIKDRFRNILSGKADSKDDVSDNSNGRNSRSSSNPFNQAIDAAKNTFINFLKRNPHLALILLILLFFFVILIICSLSDELDGNKNNSNGKCNYSLNGVLSTGTVNLEGLQVELVNCDATSSNYTVLETVDFEKYVVGVALAEISYSRDNPEYFKTGIIAARNFALTRNKSMCPSNPDNCFYGYNPNTGKIRMRACEADQVYWDYDKDIYRYDRGAISLYSPEINSGTIWKRALDEATKEEVLAVAEEVKGKVLVDDSGNVVHTDYVNTDQQEWNRLASEGHTYEEILNIHYGGGSISGATCSSGIIDYGDYVLSSDGHTILHEPLDSFLESHGTSLEAFNGLIQKNVQKAGYGTRAGVVAAAVTLIAELGNNYNVKVPYYWGGGHADGVVDGALGYWGSTQCHTYANNQSYNYCGLDCSGFVPWAIKNGGFNIAQMLAGNFQNMSGVQKVSLSGSPVLEPGDLLESSGHIVLVVGVEESTGNYICAEASGNAAGVLFTRRPFNSSGYWGIKMDGWYATHQRGEQG